MKLSVLILILVCLFASVAYGQTYYVPGTLYACPPTVYVQPLYTAPVYVLPPVYIRPAPVYVSPPVYYYYSVPVYRYYQPVPKYIPGEPIRNFFRSF